MNGNNGSVTHIPGSLSYEIVYDGQIIGYADTYAAGLRILSNERLARATHRHLEYGDLAAMRAAGTFATYVADLDDDGLGAVAHILVVGNHAAGRDVDYDTILATLVRIRDNAGSAARAAGSKRAEVLIVAAHEPEVQQIVVRRGIAGEVLAYCDTWLQVDEVKRRIALSGI